jgi:hypothetical protein
MSEWSIVFNCPGYKIVVNAFQTLQNTLEVPNYNLR